MWGSVDLDEGALAGAFLGGFDGGLEQCLGDWCDGLGATGVSSYGGLGTGMSSYGGLGPTGVPSYAYGGMSNNPPYVPNVANVTGCGMGGRRPWLPLIHF